MPELRNPTLQKGVPELGAGRISFLLTLACAAAFAYLLAVFVPAYLDNQRMQEATEQIVHRAATQNLSEADTRAQLHEKAREFGLPEDYAVAIKREGKVMTASVTYKRRLRLPFYKEWPVRIEVKDLGF
ncbi:MAG TPA: hypothetical protein VJ810_13375 [Blastocatellia bacterium]|nr:hypothetical protein [Blastocatellia bacterium]